MVEEAEVVVVGGGLSGLVAAESLAARGHTVVLVEASNRLGGRINTVRWPNDQGTPFEGGPSYVGPTQRHMQRLIRRFNLSTQSTFFEKGYKSVNHFEQWGMFFRMVFEGATHIDVPEIDNAIIQLDRFTAELMSNPEQPWLVSGARELDAITVSEWSDAELDGPFGWLMARLLATFVRTILSVEPREISMLFLLWYCARMGGFKYVTQAFDYGPDSRRIREGNDSVVRGLRASFEGSGNGTLLLNTPVTEIASDPVDQQNGKVEVRTGLLGARVTVARGDHAIVALPPPLAVNRIAFDPVLDDEQERLFEEIEMGRTIKGYLLYERAWWREKPHLTFPISCIRADEVLGAPPDLARDLLQLPTAGLDFPGYTGYSNGERPHVVWTMDASSQDDDGNVVVPAIMWFVTADRVEEFGNMTDAQQRGAIHEQLCWTFDGAPAPDPIHFLKFTYVGDNGGPTGVFKPGLLTTLGEFLRRPHHRIHWAGTEMGVYFGGYMEGAADAGLRAAHCVNSLIHHCPAIGWPDL